MLRIIYFGMTGNFSVPPVEKLVAAGLEPEAVLLPATWPANPALPRRLEPPPLLSDLPIVNPHFERHLLHLAWANDIPVWEVGSLSGAETLGLLAALKPDLIMVACFTYRFSPAVLDLPRFGSLNLHPSLLPAYRGPVPIFWMARRGEEQAGVTLHFLDEGLDTGDIVTQTVFPWPEGISGAGLEQRCGEAGAGLLLDAVERLAEGRSLPRRPQPAAGGSYFPRPGARDCLISTDWPARRAFNFVRAAQDWPLTIEVGTERFPVRVAVGYDSTRQLDKPYLFHHDELWIRFQPGVLRIRRGY